jgi:hypothetical protein
MRLEITCTSACTKDSQACEFADQSSCGALALLPSNVDHLHLAGRGDIELIPNSLEHHFQAPNWRACAESGTMFAGACQVGAGAGPLLYRSREHCSR